MAGFSRLRSETVAAVIASVWLSAPLRGQQELSVDEVLTRVNSAMRALSATLPEFVCTETFTVSLWDKGKLKEEHRVDSTLTFVRDPKVSGGVRELRETTAIDGKPVGPKAKLSKVPPRMLDGFVTNALFARFVTIPPRTAHRLAGFEEVTDAAGLSQASSTRAVRVEFASSPPPRSSGLQVVSTVAGSMLIDPETMRLMQIELHSANGNLVVSGQFHNVRIGEETYWLPQFVRHEVLGPLLLDAVIKSNRTSRYSAEFSGCRKFQVSVRMLRPIE